MKPSICGAFWLALAIFSGYCDWSRAEESSGGQKKSEFEVNVPTNDGAQQKVAIRYLLFTPANYSADGELRWPLLLFLHGSGERGDDLELVKRHGPPKLVEQEAHRTSWPFITVSPQCPKDSRWNAAELAKLVEHVANTYRVDRRRIYVTGLSMGGSGTWSLLAEKPGLFAAAMPICGKGDRSTADKIAKTPVWIFVGRLDKQETVENCGDMDKAIRAAGGNSQVTYYDDLPHDCWTVTYDNPAVWKWLLTHQLAEQP